MHLSDPVVEKDTKNFPCSSCGAALTYCAGLQKLKCQYCEGEFDIDASRVHGETLEVSLTELVAMKPRPKESAPRVLECDQCGASTSVDGLRTTGRCAFCASELVQEKDASPDKIEPVAVLPFKVERETAVKSFRSWVSGLWFRPNDLKTMAKVAAIEGVYTPFWTFDASAHSRWRGEAGHHYYVTEEYRDSEGKTRTRQVQKTRWEWASGEHFGEYDDILVCGSKGLSPDLLRRLEPYDTQTSLVNYDLRFLAGWAAEEYAVAPSQAWTAGKQDILNREYHSCANLVPGDTHRNLQVSTELGAETGKHLLLPVWVAAYRYGDKSYRFLVNGETGKVSGEAPYSWWKIFFAVLAVVIVVFLLMASKR